MVEVKLHIKDLGQLKYFLANKEFISVKRNVFNMLEETSLAHAKPVDSPLETGTKLLPDYGELMDDVNRYRRLVGKLIYLTVTRLDLFLQ